MSPAQLLLAESELLVANQYLRALLQRRMVCKSREERGQLCHRLLQDATQLRELFCGLVRGAWVQRGAGAVPRKGSITSHPPAPLQPTAHEEMGLLHLGGCEANTGWIRDPGHHHPAQQPLKGGTC